MYINSRVRARARKKLYQSGPGIAGLGGASDCGAGQTWYPNVTYAGVTGQCVNNSMVDSSGNIHMPDGTVLSASAAGPSGSSADITSIIGASAGILGKLFGSQPQPVVMPAQGGMDTTTLLVLGGLGLGALLLLTRRGD